MFLSKTVKILPFSKRQNQEKNKQTKTALVLALCSMLITFLQ